MAVPTKSGSDITLPHIRSLPNLRLICLRPSASGIGIDVDLEEPLAGIYRSSKPDRISAEDIVEFRKLGIKSIIDFRSLAEYKVTDGLCNLDREYSIYKVLLPKKKYRPMEAVKSELIVKCDEDLDLEAELLNSDNRLEKKHFFLNFFSPRYVIAVVRRLPWYLFIWAILHFAYDILMRNKFKTFIPFFIKYSVNTGGILGQYIDIVDQSGVSICAALKLASDPNNMPVLINCAHGKDRTGIMSALILTCLGMSPEYVAQEYSLSENGLKPIYQLVHDEMISRLKMKEEFLSSEARTMHQLLDYITKKYGSVEDYMVSIGFSLAEQKALKENLVAFESQQVKDICHQNPGHREEEEDLLPEEITLI